jgi:DNA-binding NarL/FixJ family response regulator
MKPQWRDNSGAMGLRVLIVDDHAGFRAHARRFLECEGYEVVGEAADSASALEAAQELQPDLVLVDVHLPDFDGFELSSRLVALAAPPEVVLTSSHDGAELEPAVDSCGARGFVPKADLSRDAIEGLLP